MQDIPVFATQLGVASLELQQIPYTENAYIKLQSSENIDDFIKECASFCKMAGAVRVYASGADLENKYPLHTQIWRMSLDRPACTETAMLFPLQENTLGTFLEIYNNGMRSVPNATYLSKAQGRLLLKEKEAYFAHLGGEQLGIGIISGNKIEAVVSCRKGAGELIMNTLCGAISTETVEVEVASENLAAVRLYERMGFVRVEILNTWYDVSEIK